MSTANDLICACGHWCHLHKDGVCSTCGCTRIPHSISEHFFEQVEADLESLRRGGLSRSRVVADLVRAALKIEAMERANDFSAARYPLVHLAALAAWLAGDLEQGHG